MSTCDRCGGPVGAQWSNKDGRDIVLCTAHSVEHYTGLQKAGFFLVWDVRLDTEEVTA